MSGRLRVTLLGCAIAATVAGCGSGDDGTIPGDDSAELLRLLEAIESEVQNGNCELAQQQADQFATQVSQLSEDVDAKVRQGLSDASTRLIELSNDPGQCEEVTGASGEVEAELSTTTTTTTTEESSTTTPDPESTTTQPEEEEEEEPPLEDEDDGDVPLETPNDNEGSGGRGPTDSGGLEPEKRR